MKVSLNKIKSVDSLVDAYKKLDYLFITKDGEDLDIPMLIILQYLGLEEVISLLELVEGYENEKRLLYCDLISLFKHDLTDARSINAIDVSRRYALGTATKEELSNAKKDADDIINEYKDLHPREFRVSDSLVQLISDEKINNYRVMFYVFKSCIVDINNPLYKDFNSKHTLNNIYNIFFKHLS